MRLDRLSARLLETLLMGLYEDEGEGLNPKTVNKVLQAVAVPLAEAARLGMVRENPALRVRKLAEGDFARENLSREEARAFFGLPWADPRLKTVNLLAAMTGMRLGECRGLLAADIVEGGIRLSHNWQDREGIKGPKGSRGGKVRLRPIPLAPATEAALRAVAASNPWGDGFVFGGAAPGRPISKRLIEASYNEGLAAIGIDEATRKARGLGFHAWRHWLNSQLRGQVPDHVLRVITGHATAAMTEHYTQVTAEQRAAVVRLSTALVADDTRRDPSA